MRYGVVVLGLVIGLSACRKPEITVVDVPKNAPRQSVAFSSKSNQSRFRYHLPEGWSATDPGPMRLAQFSVPAGRSTAGLSVTTLSGDAGGLLSNVNRWRGQLGLGPISDGDLQQSIKLMTSNGLSFRMIDMANPATGKRVIGAVAQTETDTWFFKLEGESGSLDGAKPQFEAFIRSVEVTQ
ncbi:hypothetical protein EBR57_07255 [bacterium]|nr:hypothetical protein [bacterium]